MNSFSCVITGHRPTRFKFKYNEKDITEQNMWEYSLP